MLAAQLSFNIGAALAKDLFAAVGPAGVAALRTTIAALLLVAVARPWRLRPDRRQARFLVLYGLALGAMNLTFYYSIERLPIGVAVAIEISGPLAVVLFTSRTPRDFAWFALAAGSLALLLPWPGDAARLDPAGLLFALAAAAFWALYIVFGKRAAEVKGAPAVAIGMAVSCLITLPFGVAEAGSGLLAPPVLLVGLAVALASSMVPYVLEMVALERLTSRIFGVLTASAPAIAALAGFVVLGERLTLVQALAVAGMIAASAGCSLTRRKAA
jgi:inner membrane transporter RhtA